MNMTLTFWLIAASLGLVSAGLVDPTQHDVRYGYGYGVGDDDGSHYIEDRLIPLSLCPGTMEKLLALCPEKLHCPVPLEILFEGNSKREAFDSCNTDDDYVNDIVINGLTWMEVVHCIEKFEGKKHGLPIPTMTEEEFKGYDVSNDGIVTWEEYKGLGASYA